MVRLKLSRSDPVPPPNAGAAFLKFLPRTADDYATVSAAAVLHVGPGDLCEEVRVAIGSAGVTPIRAIHRRG